MIIPEPPDWGEIAKIVSGISPYHHLVTKPSALMDPMVDVWKYKIAKDEYSDLTRMMHKLGVAVHPWPMQDDWLIYKKTAYEETKMFVKQACDGFFVEFPANSYRWFTELGNYSTLNYEHLEHNLESKDLNLEIAKSCIANRHKHECMSNDTLFGGSERIDAFLAPEENAT